MALTDFIFVSYDPLHSLVCVYYVKLNITIYIEWEQGIGKGVQKKKLFKVFLCPI